MISLWRKIFLLPLLLHYGRATEESSSEERRMAPKLPSRLNLSRHELHTLVTTFIEATALSCKDFEIPELRLLETFLANNILLNTPEASSSNPEYLKNYNKLEACVELNSGRKNDPELMRKLPSIPNYKRAKRDIHVVVHEEDNILSKKHEFLEKGLSIDDLERSFENFFRLLLSITNVACPPGKRPDSRFMTAATVEMLDLITFDSDTFQEAQLKYFYNTKMLENLKLCSKKLEVARFTHTGTKTFAA